MVGQMPEGHEPGARVCGQEKGVLAQGRPSWAFSSPGAPKGLNAPVRTVWEKSCPGLVIRLSTSRNSLTDTEGVSDQLSLHPSQVDTYH